MALYKRGSLHTDNRPPNAVPRTLLAAVKVVIEPLDINSRIEDNS